MSVRLPDDDVAFYLARNQLPPRERSEFQERVTRCAPCTGCRWHRRRRRSRALSRGGRARQGDDFYCGHGVDTKPGDLPTVAWLSVNL
jgi:hypothetical protein